MRVSIGVLPISWKAKVLLRREYFEMELFFVKVTFGDG